MLIPQADGYVVISVMMYGSPHTLDPQSHSRWYLYEKQVRALWKHYDDSAGQAFLQRRQALHVSVLSMLSFVGRLISGKNTHPEVKPLINLANTNNF